MNFPEKVTFRLVDCETKKIVKNIAVLLILYAHKKNNYSIEAKISNSNGEVAFTKQDCLKDIENSKSFYLMDYASSLEECLPYISIEIISRDTINYVLKDRRESRDVYQNYWDCSEKFLKALEATDNAKYINKLYDFSEADLWKKKILEIELEPS
jgi:hypothetical protein